MKTYRKRWVGLFVLVLVAGFLCSQCTAATTARGDVELARALLDRVTAGQQKVSNFSCTVENSCTTRIGTEPGTPRDHGAYNTETRRFAFDNTGRARVELVDPVRRGIDMWDGRESIHYSGPNVPYCGDAVITRAQRSETSLRNRAPWTLWGHKYCTFLRRTLSSRSRVTVKPLDDDLYRIEADYTDSGKGIALVDCRRGYTVVRQEYHIAGELRQIYWSRFQEVRPGLWFPVEGEHVRFYKTSDGSTRQARTRTKIADIVLNDPSFDRHFCLKLPFGTEIRDYSTGKHYVVGCRSQYNLADPQLDSVPNIRTINTAATQQEAWQEAFDKVYHLDSSQSLKRIPPPFIPQRSDYASSLPRKVDDFDRATMVWNWDGGLKPRMYWEGRFVPIHEILTNMLGLKTLEFGGSRDLLNLRLAGDWIVREGVPGDELLKGLEEVIRYETLRDIRFVRKPEQTAVVIARGTYSVQPLSLASEDRIHLFADRTDLPREERTGRLSEMLEYIESRFGKPVIDQTESSDVVVSWRAYDCAPKDAQAVTSEQRDVELAKVLSNVVTQTGLSFDVEAIPLEKWFVVGRIGH